MKPVLFFDSDGLVLQVNRNEDGTLAYTTFPRPSDMHTHVRGGDMLRVVVDPLLRWVHYGLIMPNTVPVLSIQDMLDYQEQILAVAHAADIDPKLIMTLYLTDRVTPSVIEELASFNPSFPAAIKYYPPQKDVTTGSGSGIPLTEAHETLRAMEVNGVRLLLHGETARDKHGKDIPYAERESYFIEEEFYRLRNRYPNLPICLEHISKEETIEAVREDTSGKTVCTITPHHLLLTMSELQERSWRNHGRCMPYIKTAADRTALQEFAASGDARCILGTDCAPHPKSAKEDMPFAEAACGAYVPHALAMYVRVFEQCGALDERFLRFACINGPRWWGVPLPENDRRVLVTRSTDDIPDPTPVPNMNDVIIPLGWTEENDPLVLEYAHTQSFSRCAWW